MIIHVCVFWCARLWSSRLAQRNLSLPGPPDSNVHRPHALGAFGTVHCGVGRWGVFIYKKTVSTLLAQGCLLCLLAEVAWSNFQPRPKRTIDRVLLYKIAAVWAVFLGRWKLYKMALGFLILLFEEHECACLTFFGWTCENGCGWKRSKTVDRQHHFVGPEFETMPFCRLEKRSQSHFVDKKLDLYKMVHCDPKQGMPTWIQKQGIPTTWAVQVNSGQLRITRNGNPRWLAWTSTINLEVLIRNI